MSPAEIKKKFLQGILMINNAVRTAYGRRGMNYGKVFIYF